MFSYRSINRLFALLCLSGCMISQIGQAQTKSDPALVKQQFQTMMSHLDSNGELLVVANMDGVLEDFVKQATQLLNMMPMKDAETTKATINNITDFAKKNGFYGVKGIGFSAVPREDGMSTVKSFISRDKTAAMLPLWRSWVGTRPVLLTSLDFLPKDTVIANISTGDIKQFWELVKNGINEIAPPKAATAFNNQLMHASIAIDKPIDQLITSFSAESFFSIQLSSTNTITLPLKPGQQPLTMPSPSLLIGIAVKDDSVSKMIVSQLIKKQMPLATTSISGATLHTVTIPLPSPVPLQPTFTTYKEMFLFGSSPQVVTSAIMAFNKKDGLASTKKFKQAFSDLPMTNNGLNYISPRWGQTIIDVQSRSMASSSAIDFSALAGFQNMMKSQKTISAAMVTINLNSGVLTKGISSSGGKEIASSVIMMPVAMAGMMSAIAIPSFVKARSTSQKNACINNLRIIDSAKEQWALANNRKNGDPVDAQGILQYIRGNRLPTCPKNGVYTIGLIDESPKCSIKDHLLP